MSELLINATTTSAFQLSKIRLSRLLSPVSNPYASPAALPEPEVPSLPLWQVDGLGLFVKNGTVLPQVDLETGECHEGMKQSHRVYHPVRASIVLLALCCAVAAVMIFTFLDRGKIVAFASLFLLSYVFEVVSLRRKAARGEAIDRVVMWEFLGARNLKGRLKRRKLRIGAGIALVMAVLAIPTLLSPSREGFLSIVVGILGSGVAGVIALSVWALLDGPKTRFGTAPRGWMHLSPIHPDALALLRDAQQKTLDNAGSGKPTRTRRIHTHYYYRYPLRLLIGSNRNPRTILRIALLKLEHSAFLQQDSYHHSEAVPTPLGELCPPLRDAVDAWLTSHPGWTFIAGDQIDSPVGHAVRHSAFLASPGLDHSAHLSWSGSSTLENGASSANFGTWLADGTLLITRDSAIGIVIHPTVREFSVPGGTPDSVFQAHLTHCAGRPIDPPRDAQDLLARLHRYYDETNCFLVQRGYLSNVREVES